MIQHVLPSTEPKPSTTPMWLLFGVLLALIGGLASELGLSVVVVTHDLDTLYTICDRVAVLSDRTILAVAPVRELEHSQDPWLRNYLLGTRTRAGRIADPKVVHPSPQEIMS